MSITGSESVPEGQWEDNLQSMGIVEPRSLAVHCQAVVNHDAVRALSEYLGVRCALAPHSFPLDDPLSPSPTSSPPDPSGSAGS
eukprot:1243442-Rhodomonas_salina.1